MGDMAVHVYGYNYSMRSTRVKVVHACVTVCHYYVPINNLLELLQLNYKL